MVNRNAGAWKEYVAGCENPTGDLNDVEERVLAAKLYTKKWAYSWERYRNIKLYFETDGSPQPQVPIHLPEVGVDQYVGITVNAANVTFVQFMWEQDVPNGPNNRIWHPKSMHALAPKNCFFMTATCQAPHESDKFRCVTP